MVRFVIGSNGKFNLDISGVAGFFGGDESKAAMASVNLIRWRWIFGWYNSPGSYTIARTYGVIADSGFWDGFFPGKGKYPERILGLDGQKGPRFLGAQSGTRMDETGHLAHLLFSHYTEVGRNSNSKDKPKAHAQSANPQKNDEESSPNEIPQQSLGRFRCHSDNRRHNLTPTSTPIPNDEHLFSVTIVPKLVDDDCTNSIDDYDSEMTGHLDRMSTRGLFFAFGAIGASIAAAVLVAVKLDDFICCIALSVGILFNGIATGFYGYGTLSLQSHPTIQNAVPGDGAFVGSTDVVIVQGPERQIAKITRAKYKLTYSNAPTYCQIGWVSIALHLQAVSQLILLPAATLHGQIVFLGTFVVSWLYNAYLASHDREKLQFVALKKKLKLDGAYERKPFARWAAIAAASAFYLRPAKSKTWLEQLIPNETDVWKIWRKHVAHAVDNYTGDGGNAISFDVRNLYDSDIQKLSCDDVDRLIQHLADAKEGYEWITGLMRASRTSQVNGNGTGGAENELAHTNRGGDEPGDIEMVEQSNTVHVLEPSTNGTSASDEVGQVHRFLDTNAGNDTQMISPKA